MVRNSAPDGTPLKNPGARCRDCKKKYAQEMGLCRGCQKRRIGQAGVAFALEMLKQLAAAKQLDLAFSGIRYVLSHRGKVVCSTLSMREATSFITALVPPGVTELQGTHQGNVVDDDQPF